MSYDFYATFLPKSPTTKDVDNLVSGRVSAQAIPDIAARLALLAGMAAQKEGLKNHVVNGDRKRGGGYKSLVHHKQGRHAETPYAEALITPRLSAMEKMGLLPTAPDFSPLPRGSWFLQFTFTLAKPWMSKDDEPFYVAESVNPVRKDTVFKVPMIAASSWKGLLRWTAMHTRLALKKGELTRERFALERFVQTLLFGDEKGEEDNKSSSLAEYLDSLFPEARDQYRQWVRNYFQAETDKALPNHRGRLVFFPTFFDLMDVEVINPHSRETRAGRQPVYLECVPAGAKGTFSLLYVPFDRAGEDMTDEGGKHLRYLAPIISKMFLTYGFSAKRSSGYGVAKDAIQGKVHTKAGETPLTRLSQLDKEVSRVAF